MIKSKKNLLCLFFAFAALVFSTIFAVSISSKANAAPENITLVFSKLAGCQDNVNRYVIDFTADVSDLGDEFWNNNEATLIDSDGNIKKISGGGLNYIGSGSELTLYLEYNHLAEGATTAEAIGEHAFYLPAGTKIGGVSTLKNDVALRINKNAVSNLEVKPLALSGGGAQDNFSRFLVRFKGGIGESYAPLGKINVLIDGTLQKVDFCDLGGGDFGALLDYSVCEKDKDHTLKFMLGAVTGGDYFFNNDLTVYIVDNAITEKEKGVTLDNASIKIGGEYSDAYYSFDGTWNSAGWFVNNVATTGNINVKYTIESETRTAGGVYGVTRLINANASNKWAVAQGLIDFTQNGSAGTWQDVSDSKEILLSYNSATHRRTLNNGIIWGYSTTEVSGVAGSNTEGNDGVTDAYENADALGANRFGVAWGGGTYSLKTSLQIYDDDNNDLGVLWSTPEATVTSRLVGKIGGKIYFKSAFENVGSVSVVTESGTNVETTDEGNGLYSFTMPSEAVTISTTEKEEPQEGVINYVSGAVQSDRYVLLFDGVGDGSYNPIGQVNVTINGDGKSLDFINWGDETALLLPFDVCSNDDSKLSEITIKSCKVGNFVIKNDINLWISGTKFLTKDPRVTLTRNGGEYQSNDEDKVYRYVVYFNDVTGGDFAYIGNLAVTVDGKTEKNEAFYEWSGGKSAVLLNASDYPLDTEFKITTKTGWVGDYYIVNSVTFYIYNEQIIDKTPVTVVCGDSVYSSDIVWSEVALSGVFSAKNVEKNGLKVIGYRYENVLYESLSKVYAAIGETAPTSVLVEAVTTSLTNVYGASIRLANDYQGLRFTTSISANRAEEIKEYGMYATSEAFLKKLGGDFTAIADGTNGYKVSSTDENFRKFTDGGIETYSTVITLSAANYNKKFVACGYLTVTYADGTTKTILADYVSEANMRSAYEVATKALENSSKYNAWQLNIIRKYADGVLDIDEKYNLVGAERSYTIEKIADGQIRITGKADFDAASVGAFSINGVRYPATFENGVVTFDAGLLTAGTLEAAIKASGRDGRELEVMSYYGPSLGIHLESGKLTTDSYACSTVEDVKKYFDAGFNYLVADEADTEAYRYEGINYGGGSGMKDDAKRMLDLVALYCDTYEIKDKSQAPVVLYDSFIWALMDKNEYANLGKTDEEIKNILSIHFDTYKNYVPEYPKGYTYKTNGTPLNCFAGFTLRDEPYGEDLDCYNAWYNYLAYDMGLIDGGYVLVGAVISPGVNGQYMVGHAADDYTVVTDETYYNDYLRYIVENMKNNSLDNGKQYLMSDCYPFLTTLSKKALTSKVTSTYKISSHYFSMMAMYANAAKENGFKAGVCIQSVTHYNAADYKAVMSGWSAKSAECNLTGRIDKDGNLTMNENHIRYQAYMALAYGMERIDYFTYWQHYNQTAVETMKESAVVWEYDEAAGTYKGVYLPMYDYIKAANAEAKKLDEVALAFDWQGTRLIAGQTATTGAFGDAASYSGDGVANGVTSIYDLAVGCFTLGSDYKGYMLVNADDPSNTRNNIAELNFGGEYGHAICYINGTPVMKTLDGGKLSLTLGAGDGTFVVPVK